MNYELVRVASAEDWRVYHQIRRAVLFEARGRFGIYSEVHEDEFQPNHYPLLLKFEGVGIGTTRLDDGGSGSSVVRLVAIRGDLQKRGHGRMLSRLVEEFAGAHGIGTLHVNSALEATGFYEKMGWERYAWNPAELLSLTEKVVQMRKILSRTL